MWPFFDKLYLYYLKFFFARKTVVVDAPIFKDGFLIDSLYKQERVSLNILITLAISKHHIYFWLTKYMNQMLYC